jgi:excisionase family DNA binding protein
MIKVNIDEKELEKVIKVNFDEKELDKLIQEKLKKMGATETSPKVIIHMRGGRMSELLEVVDVAKLLKCNRNTVYQLIKKGYLVGLKLGRMKVSTIELEDFIIRNAGMDMTDLDDIKPLEIVKDE